MPNTGPFHGMQVAERFLRTWIGAISNPTPATEQAVADHLDSMSDDDLAYAVTGLATIAAQALNRTGDWEGALRWIMLTADVEHTQPAVAAAVDDG